MLKKSMKKIILLLFTLIVFSSLSSVVFAANWPNMKTGPSTSGGKKGGGGGSYTVHTGKACTGTRYTLTDQNGNIIKVYEDICPNKIVTYSNGLIGNTNKWIYYNNKDNKMYPVSETPHIKVGDELFDKLLELAGKQASDVITVGKNTFTIKAEVIIKYESKGKEAFYTYNEVVKKGWTGTVSKDAWKIACDELGYGDASDVSQGTYYLPVISHKELGTGRELARTTAFNRYQDNPYFNIGITTQGVATDYSNIINSGYSYVGISKGSSQNAKTTYDTTATSITTDENNLYVTLWYSKGGIPQTNTTNLTVMYKERGTNNIISPTESYTITGRTDKYYKDISGYSFVGSEKDTEGFSTATVQVIWEADGKAHTIIFWYEKEQAQTSITVHYKDETTGQDIPGYPPESKTPGRITSKTIPGYTYTGVQENAPTPKSKTSNPYVDIPDDGQNHDITFWYRARPKITIYYKSKTTNTDLMTPYVGYLDKGTTSRYQNNAGALPGFEYVDGKLDGGASFEIPYCDVYGDGNDHTIIFYFIQKIDVTVVAAYYDEEYNKYSMIKVLNPDEDKDEAVPYKKTFKADDYNAKVEGYDFLNKYSMIPGTSTYYGQKPQYDGNSYTLSVSETKDSTPTSKYLIVFYYKAKYYLTVEHMNEATRDFMQGTKSELVALLPGGRDVSSKTFTNFFNSRSLIDGESNMPSGVQYKTDKYTVHVDYNENPRTQQFWYVQQKVEVHHQGKNGKELVKPEEVYVPTEQTTRPDIKYPFENHELNNEGPKPEDRVTVLPDPNTMPEKQILIFVYDTEPELVVDPNNPSDPAKQKIAKELGVGVIPKDLNNQLIGQNNDEKYWVLDNKNAALTVGFAEIDEVGQIAGHDIKLTFPFDVYIDTNGDGVSELVKELTFNLGDFNKTTQKASDGKEYTVYKKTINNIEVPVWVNEEEYKDNNGIKLNVVQKYTVEEYDETTGGKVSSNYQTEEGATGNVTVVGQIYDFSVTSLLGDDIWKASAFTAAATGKGQQGEHEADTLPVGQGNAQQNSKYIYGIKQGSKFYFSVNTKGSNNTAIKIVPQFYYVDKNGTIVDKVKAYSGGKEISAEATTLARTATITDANRTTSEFRSEMAKAREIYAGVTYGTASTGTYTNIKLGTNLRTPYLQYLNENYVGKDKLPTGVSDTTLLQEASHWYGDYMLPNDTTYTLTDGTAVGKDGFVVVYFSIVSGKGTDGETPYLSYNLASPDDQTTERTQWEVEEQQGKYTLPKVTTSGSGAAVSSWLRGTRLTKDDGYAPVIIYDIDQSTTQNYDSTGTH